MKCVMGPFAIDVSLSTEGLDEDDVGAWFASECAIRLNPSQNAVSLSDTFIHELCEASNGIRDLKLSHTQIQTLATDLTQALLSSKCLNVKQLLKKLEK